MDDWDLVGGNPAPGEHEEASSLGGLFDDVADIANGAKASLIGIRDQTSGAIWTGEAAREFQQRIEELPEHLDKLHDSYATAASALRTFGSDLDALQDRATTELNLAVEADAEVTRLQQQQDEASRAAASAPPGQAVASPSYDSDIQEARNRLTSARSQVQDIRDDMTGAEDRCIEGLERGQDQGMRNQSPWAAFCEIVGNVLDFLAMVLMIIAIVIVVLLVCFTPLGLFAALAFIGPLMALCTALSAISLGTLVARRALGDEVSLSDIAEGAVLLLLPSGLARAGRAFLTVAGRSARVTRVVAGAEGAVRNFYQSGTGDRIVRGLTNGGSRVTRAADTIAIRSGTVPVVGDMRRLESSFSAARHETSGAARLQRGYYIDVMAEGRNFDIMTAVPAFGVNTVTSTTWLIEHSDPSPSLPPLVSCTPVPTMGPSDPTMGFIGLRPVGPSVGPISWNFPMLAGAR